MPDLIRHPEHTEITGLQLPNPNPEHVLPKLRFKRIPDFLRNHQHYQIIFADEFKQNYF